MYLLKKVVQELCRIDDELHTKLTDFCWHPDPFQGFVEYELDKVLRMAVLNLLPMSEPTVVHPIPDPCASTNFFARAVQWISDGACMLWIRGCQKEREVPAGEMLVEYLDTYYPPHTDYALEKCKHILDCVYRVVCGHVKPRYQWGIKQSGNLFLESIPGATQLEEVGIMAEKSSQCTGNSVELTLGHLTWIRSARFKLPKVEIFDHTARDFHNLAIYEQLLGQDMTQYNSDLRCYLGCMHELCRDAADLQLLSKSGVINAHVRNEVALCMWGRILGVERPIPSDDWKICYNNVHQHRHSRWNAGDGSIVGCT